VFVILVIINFVVVTKGAGRNRRSQRALRARRDARQADGDRTADLNAGLIEEAEAKRRRRRSRRSPSFDGAMDGASSSSERRGRRHPDPADTTSFGGFMVGVVQHGMSAGAAMETYTLLTIGDGLVAQIPALVIRSRPASSSRASATRATSRPRRHAGVLEPARADADPPAIIGVLD